MDDAVDVPGVDSRRLVDVIGLGVVTRLIHRDLVDEVLADTGRREKRARSLPARVVVYLVMALCLFTADGYEEVVRKLTNGLMDLRVWRCGWQVPVPSAVSAARTRLGSEPMAALFERVCVPVAKPWTIGAFYGDLRVMAVDGTVLDIPDTPDNAATFGYYAAGTSRQSAFPQVRMLTLVECGTHAAVAAVFDSVATSERALTVRLARELTSQMILLADRGFYSYELFTTCADTGAQLLWRISDITNLPVKAYFPDGSFLAELPPPRKKPGRADKTDRGIGFRPVHVRVIEYMVTNRKEMTETIRLVTTITDPAQAPADTLAALYQQRWEHEIAFDQTKPHLLHPTRVLRSRTPDLIKQEIWALLIVHYAAQVFITEAADDLGADPDRYSFTRTINVIRRQVLNQAAFSPLNPEHRDQPDDH